MTTTATMIQTNTNNMNKNTPILTKTLSSNSMNEQNIKTNDNFSKTDNEKRDIPSNSIPSTSSDIEPKNIKDEDEKIHEKKRKKMRKLVTITNLTDDNQYSITTNISKGKSRLSFLPYNEYETVLKRRVRENGDDDMSLGMKLTIIGGRVIVQSLNSLNNGCASPAQLCGLINIGDVLVNVQNVPLRNLALEKIVDALKPLSDEMLDELVIRFAIGEGLDLLNSSQKSGNEGAEPDLFSFPLFPGVLMPPPASQPLVVATKKMEEEQSQVTEEGSISSQVTIKTSNEPQQLPTTIIDTIALHIMEYHASQDKRWPSPFYNHSTNILLKPPMENNLSSEYSLKQKQLLIFTQRQKETFLLKFKTGAKHLCDYIQENEPPLVQLHLSYMSSNRSLASMSHFSVANTVRRRQIKWDIIHEEDEESSNSSYSSQHLLLHQNDDDSSVYSTQQHQNGGNYIHPNDIYVDQDHGLIGLLDDDTDTIIWKERLMHFLNYQKQQEQNSPTNQETDTNTRNQISEEKSSLESLFFGKDVAKILTSQTISLPEKNITQFLYHCILSKAPNMLTSSDDNDNAIVFDFNLHKYYSKDITFLCKDVIPIWMTLFTPLGIDCRNLLFPYHDITKGLNQQECSDDSTVITENTNNLNQYFQSNTRQSYHIEDSKLDPDVRIQTCYILTFYFIYEVLPTLNTNDSTLDAVDQCNKFIKNYGAYLQLYPSFVHLLRCDKNKQQRYVKIVLESLLNIARVDYIHKEVGKELMTINTTNIDFRYEQVMLSPLLDFLFTYCTISDSTKPIPRVSVFVSAYPDLNPWFVRDLAGMSQPVFYYSYLSALLSPQNENTHNNAKRDQSLVMEWSNLSASQYHTSSEHRQNLQLVLCNDKHNFDNYTDEELHTITKTSINRMYNCDLLKLMEVSIQVCEYNIALNLGIELIQTVDEKKQQSSSVHNVLLEHLYSIASVAISREEKDGNNDDNDDSSLSSTNLLSKIILIYNTLSSYSTMYNIPEQLLRLFELSLETTPPSTTNVVEDTSVHENKKLQELIRLIRAKANPKDALASLLLLLNKRIVGSDKCSINQSIPSEFWMEVLQHIVTRDATIHFKEELSGCLLIMNHLRDNSNYTFSFAALKEQRDNDEIKEDLENEKDSAVVASSVEGSIWDRVLNGTCDIDK